MKTWLSTNLVRQSLAGHSWLGLLAGVLLYLVCLTGVPLVFMNELGRWEQPQSEILQDFDGALLDRAYRALEASQPDYQGPVYFDLPVVDLPRLLLSTDSATWRVHDDGSLAEPWGRPFVDQLIALHVHLNLPEEVGIVLVGLLGALMSGLVISGVFAHPRIFRDAFRLRWGDGSHLAGADLHNRLGVWSLPFLLGIAISGAFFGVYNFALSGVSQAYGIDSPGALIGTIYGGPPTLDEPPRTPQLAVALARLQALEPGVTVFQANVEERGTAGQHIVLSAKHPGRLIHAEEYYFSSAGELLEKHGFSDGPGGRQLLFSIHSLHLGNYGGLGIKLLYAVLGLASTVVAASGITVWLRRRRREDSLARAWPGFVWGLPLALVLAALARVLFGLPTGPVFWLALVAALAFALRHPPARSRRTLLQALAALLVLLVAAYCAVHGRAAFNPLSLVVNVVLLTTMAVLLLLARTGQTKREELGERREGSDALPADGA